MASRKSSILVVAHSKQQNIIPCLTTVLFWQLPLIIAVYQTLARTHNISKVRCVNVQVFWSYNYRLITTVQQHENLQPIVASQVETNCDSMLSSILALFARISKLLWLNIRSTGAEVVGGQKTFSSNGCSSLNASLSQVPRPRPKPRLEGSKTKTKTKTLRF